MKSKSIFDNKIVKILFPLVLAFGLWLYVVTVVSPGSETVIHNVQVTVPSQRVLWQRGLMIVSDTELTVDVKLEGNRTDLNNLDKSDIIVEVHLTKIYDAGTHETACNVRVSGNVAAQADPGTVKLVVVERQEKPMPITVKFNYVKGKVELDRDTVTIVGPKSLVNTVAEVAVTVDLTGHKSDIEQTLPIVLLDNQGAPVNGLAVIDTETENELSEVSVHVPVVMFKELPVIVNLISGGGATAQNTKLELSDATISVSGPETIL